MGIHDPVTTIKKTERKPTLERPEFILIIVKRELASSPKP